MNFSPAKCGQTFFSGSNQAVGIPTLAWAGVPLLFRAFFPLVHTETNNVFLNFYPPICSYIVKSPQNEPF